jgi:hypothetical protein
MPTYPWRFQADLTADNPDPDVTVFVGDTITNEVTGETKVHQDTANPEIVKLSELSSYVATAMTSGVNRTANKSVPQSDDEDEDDDKPQARRDQPRQEPPKPMSKPAPKPVQRPATRPGPTAGGQRR